jgi:hypothetical protein
MTVAPVETAQARVEAACLRQVRPETRAVTLERNAADLWVRVYHDGPCGDETSDALDHALDGAMAGIEGVTCHGSFVRCDAPAAVPALGRVLFARPGTEFRAWVEGDSF